METPRELPLLQSVPENCPRALTRRAFLRLAAAAGVAGASVVLPNPPGSLAHDGSHAGDPDDEELHPQWVMAIDLAACDGCKLCTIACQERHSTGDQEWIKVFEIEQPDGSVSFFPRPCMHCENAPCESVCPVAATFHDKHGNVLVDHQKCIGCRLCMAACPYGARSFNWEEPVNPPKAAFAKYSPEYPVPHRRGTVEKCMLCAHDSEKGKLPECVQACAMNAIWFGDLARDLVTNGIETMSLKHLLATRNGFRLKEELGTRPRVWYLPGHGEHFSKVPFL